MNFFEVTCILPAHNEGETILETILEIDEKIGLKCNLTIFVSEDGSRDNTRERVTEASRLVRNSKVLLSEKSDRLGYSKGVQRGIEVASTQFLLFMDADGQCDPNDFGNLLTSWKPNSIVVGVRSPRVDSIQRKLFSTSFKFVYELLGFPKLVDPSSPFVLVERKMISELMYVNFHLNFGFWWEFQARASQIGLTIIEIPVLHRPRKAGETQVYRLSKLPKIVRTHLMGLIKLRHELRSNSMIYKKIDDLNGN